MLYLLLLLSTALVIASPFCNGLGCNCTDSYNFQNQSCLASCPSGYYQSSSICKTEENSRLFTLRFHRYWDFSQPYIDSFSLAPNNFQDQNNSLPVPTKDRGFYFKPKSKIQNTISNIISPEFTIRLTLKVSKDGTIMKSEINGTEIYKLYVKDSKVCLNLLLSEIVDNATLNSTVRRLISDDFMEESRSWKYDFEGLDKEESGIIDPMIFNLHVGRIYENAYLNDYDFGENDSTRC